jgi:putative transposase
MTRFARLVLPGWVHHATQRGNNRQVVFNSDNDRLLYLKLLAKYFILHGLALIGYCLMDNHTHLAVIPEAKDSLARGVGQMHHDFTRWHNVQSGRSGHLWQNRFFSCPVEEDRVWGVLSYIELNPVRAQMVENAWDWEWSSAQAHVTGVDPTGLLDMDPWRKHFDSAEWRNYLVQMAAERSLAARIRKATATGRFLGSNATARRLELELGRTLLPKKRGRKPKGSSEMI